VTRPSAAEQLIAIGREAPLFHAPDGIAYASVPVGDHQETWALRSSGFKSWLAGTLWHRNGQIARAQVLQDVLTTLEAVGRFEGPEELVFVRVAVTKGAIYLDLGDEAWRAVEVTGSGWQIIAHPPVRFRRPRGLAVLPDPVHGGRLDALRPFLNLAAGDDDRWILVVGFLVGMLRNGPYPVLVLGGEQGSAKTTASRMIRAVVDPATSPDRAAPRDDRDLLIAASNTRLVAYDNLSRLPDWLSDGLARLATGAGFGTRLLYSDDEEKLFYAARPIIINGIGELAVRSDLLDRSLLVTLPRIPDSKRRPESALWPAFEAARPAILDGLLDAVSGALARYRTVNLPRLPRMADFATWVSAAEPALGWQPGTFLAAYDRNRLDAHDLALDAASITGPVQALVKTADWQGTATELLVQLTAIAGEAVARRKDWPAQPNTLSGQLRRLAPDFRAIGIEIDCDARAPGSGARAIAIRRIGLQETVTIVTPATIADEPPGANRVRDDGDDHLRPESHRATPGIGSSSAPAPDPEDYADAAQVAAAWGVDIESDYPRSAWQPEAEDGASS
jgi:hypothetical protein